MKEARPGLCPGPAKGLCPLNPQQRQRLCNPFVGEVGREGGPCTGRVAARPTIVGRAATMTGAGPPSRPTSPVKGSKGSALGGDPRGRAPWRVQGRALALLPSLDCPGLGHHLGCLRCLAVPGDHHHARRSILAGHEMATARCRNSCCTRRIAARAAKCSPPAHETRRTPDSRRAAHARCKAGARRAHPARAARAAPAPSRAHRDRHVPRRPCSTSPCTAGRRCAPPRRRTPPAPAAPARPTGPGASSPAPRASMPRGACAAAAPDQRRPVPASCGSAAP